MLVFGGEAEGHACKRCGRVTSEIAHRTTTPTREFWLCSPACLNAEIVKALSEWPEGRPLPPFPVDA